MAAIASSVDASLASLGIAGDGLRRQSANVESLRLLAAAARKERRYDDAERSLAQAMQLAPTNALLWFERGSTAFQAGRLEDALQFYRQAAQLDPMLGEAHLNVGGVLEQMERQDEALAWSRRAVELLPASAVAHYNLANVQRALADLPAAIHSFERALELDPENAKCHWNIATCHLLAGDFAAGWRKYEWRERAGAVFFDRYPQPRWDGSSLAGKSLLLHAEQGIGDEILFASCFPELIDQAERVIIVCEPRLESLFRRSFPRAKVYGYNRTKTWDPLVVREHVDFQIPAGSLPLYLRNSLASFPQRDSFLTPEPAAVALWRERFAALGQGLKVGISWRAGGRTSERRRRTTHFDDWSPLFACQGVEWINLQYGDADEELAEARDRFGITIHDWPEGDPLVDLDGFAAKLAALDLVISVGNATAHMAGAIGAEAWVLLPLVPAWRWLIAGERSPWYESVRLFRQRDLADWNVPFQQVSERLGSLLQEREIVSATRPKSALELATKRTPTDNERLDCIQDDTVLNEVAIPKVLAEAVENHRVGRLVEAETAYRQILRRSPRHADALHLLGVVARQTGRVELAIQSIRRALAVIDDQPLVHFNLGNALSDAGQADQAIASFRRALELNPDFAEARLNLGIALKNANRPGEAVKCFREAVAAMPRSAEAMWNLAGALHSACQMDEAIECLEDCLGLDPGFLRAYNTLATYLLEDGRASEALALCQRASSIDAKQAALHHTTATILRSLDRPAEAVAAYRRALELEPNRFDTLYNLAHLLAAGGDALAAETHYRQALQVRPADPHALNALGQSLEEQGRWQEAVTCYDRAIESDPQCALAHRNLALARLKLDDFSRGWQEYEWRWHCPDGPRARDYFAQPLWDGGSLAGKTILVHGEQGLGDEIVFATCYRELIERAGHVVLLCEHRLAPLFARSFEQATVIGMARGREHALQLPARPAIDVQIPAGSVPRYLRPTAASFPRERSFLKSDPARQSYWQQRLTSLGPGLKIGISWRAGGSSKDRRMRWTSPADWRAVLNFPAAQFVSLQYGDCTDDLQSFAELHGVQVHAFADFDPKRDIDELAALIASLDLVISVGNANVHLAGALGVPAWALIPKNASWGWGTLGAIDSRWYASVRHFAQSTAGNWADCFQAIRAELQSKFTPGADKT